MANNKRITVDWSETGITSYCIIRREVDNYRLNDLDGSFAVNPTDPYLSLTEDTVIKGRYEVNESRQVWNDGAYTIVAYKQAGGSPAPVSDTVIGTGAMYIVSDVEVVLDATVSSRSTLTAQGVWEYATRTLTSFGTLVSDIWAYATRLLTAGTNIVLAKGTGVTGFNDITAAEVRTEMDANSADMNSILSYVDELETRLTAVRAGYLDNLSGGAVALEATLANATYGLSALKALIDAIDTSTELQARFTEIKGAGWTTETLKAIKDAIDIINIETDALVAIKAKTDQLNFTGADVKATLDGEEVTPTVASKTGYALSSASEDSIVTKVWLATTRTLTSFGTLVSDIWSYATRKLTSAWTDEGTPRDMAATASVILPVMQTGVYQLTATQNTTISISRGDGPIKTYFDFDADYSGWTPYFGMKVYASDTLYQIEPKTATWTDATKGQGYFSLTTTETDRVGSYLGEIELRNVNDRFTPLRFKLMFEEDVIG